MGCTAGEIWVLGGEWVAMGEEMSWNLNWEGGWVVLGGGWIVGRGGGYRLGVVPFFADHTYQCPSIPIKFKDFRETNRQMGLTPPAVILKVYKILEHFIII